MYSKISTPSITYDAFASNTLVYLIILYARFMRRFCWDVLRGHLQDARSHRPQMQGRQKPRQHHSHGSGIHQRGRGAMAQAAGVLPEHHLHQRVLELPLLLLHALVDIVPKCNQIHCRISEASLSFFIFFSQVVTQSLHEMETNMYNKHSHNAKVANREQ